MARIIEAKKSLKKDDVLRDANQLVLNYKRFSYFPYHTEYHP